MISLWRPFRYCVGCGVSTLSKPNPSLLAVSAGLQGKSQQMLFSIFLSINRQWASQCDAFRFVVHHNHAWILDRHDFLRFYIACVALPKNPRGLQLHTSILLLLWQWHNLLFQSTMEAVQSLCCFLMQQVSVGSGDVRAVSKCLLLLQRDSSPRILSSVPVLIALLYWPQLALTYRLLVYYSSSSMTLWTSTSHRQPSYRKMS